MPNDSEWQTFGPPDWKPKRLSFWRRHWKRMAGGLVLVLFVANSVHSQHEQAKWRAALMVKLNELAALQEAGNP